MKRNFVLAFLILLNLTLLSTTAVADPLRATVVRVASLYVSPDTKSAKMREIERGRELVIMETIPNWVHVEATLGIVATTSDDQTAQVVTGWILDKGVVRASLPEGDKIIFGEAIDSEDQASQRHGRRGAAQDALRLYYRTAEYFPKSPLAAESMYRSADIRWQIEKVDVMSRPSAKEQEAFLREGMNDQFMKEVIKKYPGTKWADLAAFHLIENKLCGDWLGASKCPVKEAEIYENYAKDRPQSPAVAEALYDAAWRWSALIEIYKTEEQAKKSDEAKSRALALAHRVVEQFPQGDWGARAQRLVYLLEQGVPTYGNKQE
jgi:outer membrane protein assembly factor BamD (BamD/ComL family)